MIRQRNGVGIIISKYLKDYVVVVKSIVNRILLIKLVVGDKVRDIDNMWNTMVGRITRITNEVLGVSKGRDPSSKEIW